MNPAPENGEDSRRDALAELQLLVEEEKINEGWKARWAMRLTVLFAGLFLAALVLLFFHVGS